jgi:adenine-specific DNA-methyltransferase
MNEIFGESNVLSQVARVAKRSSNAGEHFSPSKDYVLGAARNIEMLQTFSVPLSDNQIAGFNKVDARGAYKEIGLFQAALKHGGSIYPIVCPDGSRVLPGKLGVPWRWNETTYLNGNAEGLIVFKQTDRSPLVDAETGLR